MLYLTSLLRKVTVSSLQQNAVPSINIAVLIVSFAMPNLAISTLRTARVVANRTLHQSAFRLAPDNSLATSSSSSSTSGSAGELSAGEKLSGILVESLKKSEESQARSASNNAGSGGELVSQREMYIFC
jgi:hypothetical protein